MDVNDINQKSIEKIRKNLIEINKELFSTKSYRESIYKFNETEINDGHRKYHTNEK